MLANALAVGWIALTLVAPVSVAYGGSDKGVVLEGIKPTLTGYQNQAFVSTGKTVLIFEIQGKPRDKLFVA